MPTTQLNYDIVPDKSPLYTTIDQLNQSSADLRVTAQNSTSQPVTVSEILIELMKVDQGADTVQLLLPGSAGGIQFPNTITGPGQATWKVTSGSDGQFTLKADAGVTFQAGDMVSLTLQNVVIREGGTGTAFVPVIEASDAGRGQTQVGIGITQSTLNVVLSSDSHLIEPNGVATLTWNTTDATSGSLTLPGNAPSSITLNPTNLVSGQQQVSPIVDTTYSLTCQGLGPNVTKQVMVSVDSLQMSDLEATADVAHLGDQVLLRWHTNADSCTLDDGSGNPQPTVPSTVPNAQYPMGYPVYPEKPTTYTLHGTKKLGDGSYVDDSRNKALKVYPVSIVSFSSSASAFAVTGTITLSWQTLDAVSCTLSTKEGTGNVSVPFLNRQVATCLVSATPDGRTLIVTKADGSNQQLGILTLPTPCPPSATFALTATGPASQDHHNCLVSLSPVQINQFTKNVGSQGHWVRGMESSWYQVSYWLEVTWNVSNASSIEVTINGSLYSNSPAGSWTGTWGPYDPPLDTATISCTGFGGTLSQ